MGSNLVPGNWDSPTESCSLMGDYCLRSRFLPAAGGCTGGATA
jgi:hypothetical protein